MANIFIDGIDIRDAAPQRWMTTPARRMQVGQHFIDHYRAGVAKRGAAAVAAQLKKQGVPLAIAQIIIFGRTTE